MKLNMRLIPLLLFSLGSPAAAQDSFASSESFVAIAPVQLNGVELATSASYSAQVKLGLVPSGETGASSLYVAYAGTAAMPPQLAPGPPLVFAALPGVGDKDGGDLITIRGLNLDDGSGTALALLGGALASGVSVSDTVLTATTGPGVNVHGNPLGRVAAEVTTSAGTGTRADAFIYSPALTDNSAPSIGKDYLVDLHAPVGSLYQVAFGLPFPGLAASVPPLEGAAEILLGIVQVTGLLLATTETTTLPIPIPDEAALIGVQVDFQAAVLMGLSPLAGTFTNRLSSILVP